MTNTKTVTHKNERTVIMNQKEIIKTEKSFPLLIKEREKQSSASLRAERLQGEVIAFEEEKKITSPHPQPFSLMRRRGQKVAFTLAETLITLTILGVIAAITVPSLINKQIESANRTKLKKAMTVYEKALNQMIIDNDLKTNDAIKTEFNNDNCATSSTYFKPVETTDSACRFKTADRVWWDISDIEAPVISLKDEIKTEANATTVKANAESLDSDHTSFVMIGYLDDTTGVLRINDLGVAKDGATIPTAKNKTYISKLYSFMNNQEEITSCDWACQFEKYKNITCENPNGNWNCKNCKECSVVNGDDIYIYNENGKKIFSALGDENCHNGTLKNCTSYYQAEYNDAGQLIIEKSDCNEGVITSGVECSSPLYSSSYTYNTDGTINTITSNSDNGEDYINKFDYKTKGEYIVGTSVASGDYGDYRYYYHDVYDKSGNLICSCRNCEMLDDGDIGCWDPCDGTCPAGLGPTD